MTGVPAGIKVKAYTWEEIKKHNKINDCWVVIRGNVCDMTQWIAECEEDRKLCMAAPGTDITEKWAKAHSKGDYLLIKCPWVIIGTVDTSDATTNVVSDFNAKVTATVVANQNKAAYSLDEVAKHNKEGDAWVTIQGDVLNVTDFIYEHPGGKLVILNLAGKDATEDFLNIHPAEVYRKHAPYLIIGHRADHPRWAKPSAGGGLNAPLLDKEPEKEDEGDYGGILGSVFYALRAVLETLFATVFSIANFKFTNDRTGLTRSAIFMMFFMVIHAVGNLHVFLGPDDFNGYGYFYVRLYWTMGGLVKANIVEVYLMLAIMLHVSVALKRTWDINRNQTLGSGKLNLALSGSCLLIFMMVHLNQFRFGATQKYYVRPPPAYYGGINWPGVLELRLFWSQDESIAPVPVRDIYKLEFDLFQDPVWVVWYMFSTGMFLLHACWGWQKVVPSSLFKIPKGHHKRVITMGWIIMACIAACYFSFPLYCFFGSEKPGAFGVS
mmetsp:Transcript_17487/g.43529  ORF Transcript_17487/g.43529 Transcript_17487/m.43529 type:complete len:494 (+) Transcript_17487:340-1821(+)